MTGLHAHRRLLAWHLLGEAAEEVRAYLRAFVLRRFLLASQLLNQDLVGAIHHVSSGGDLLIFQIEMYAVGAGSKAG